MVCQLKYQLEGTSISMIELNGQQYSEGAMYLMGKPGISCLFIILMRRLYMGYYPTYYYI